MDVERPRGSVSVSSRSSGKSAYASAVESRSVKTMSWFCKNMFGLSLFGLGGRVSLKE